MFSCMTQNDKILLMVLRQTNEDLNAFRLIKQPVYLFDNRSLEAISSWHLI